MKKSYLLLSLICFVLCAFVFFNSNFEELYSLGAEYYRNRNNINEAISLYERAFEAGCKNQKARMNYVNLLLGLPMNTDTQDKLTKFLKYPADDAAKYKAEVYVNDLRGEIHRKYPDNYISNVSYNQKILRWSHNPITYNFYNTQNVPEYFINEINNGFSVWEANSDGKIQFRRVNDNPDIVIKFNSSKISANDNEKFVVAYTKPVINTNILKNMVTDYYLTSPDGEYFTANQVYNTALHEIGHALGIMGHSGYKKSIMYLSTDMITVSHDLRKDLTKSDINTLKLLYDIKPEITDSNISKGEYTPFFVSGAETEIASVKVREAENYIKKAPNLPQGYIDLADAYVSLANYPRAVKVLNKALTLANSDEIISMIYYNLAVSYYLMSDYSQAKSFLAKSGSMQTTESGKHLLAEIYLASGSKNEAIAAYEDLILKHPNNIEYVIALTNIYIKDCKYLKARAVLKEFISKNPDERRNPKLSPYGIVKAFL